MEKWFKMFSSCIIVNGAKESLIYDIERNEFYDLSNDYKQVLESTKTLSLDSLKQEYGDEIVGFLNQFVDMEVGFFTNEPELFPEIDLTWESPYTINNAIIEISTSSKYNVSKAIEELNELGTIGYQLRFLDLVSELKIRETLNLFSLSRAKYIEVLFPFDSEMDYTFFEKIIEDFPRIIIVRLFGSPEMKILSPESEFGRKIICAEKDILKEGKEVIALDRFVIGIDLFVEAQSHNLGLNRKVCINKEGQIKNYLSHVNEFGKIDDVEIKDVISLKKFNELWYISNDKVEICKDCQYRYTCVSNSEIKKENSKYFKVDICTFDPYNNIWN